MKSFYCSRNGDNCSLSLIGVPFCCVCQKVKCELQLYTDLFTEVLDWPVSAPSRKPRAWEEGSALPASPAEAAILQCGLVKCLSCQEWREGGKFPPPRGSWHFQAVTVSKQELNWRWVKQHLLLVLQFFSRWMSPEKIFFKTENSADEGLRNHHDVERDRV